MVFVILIKALFMLSLKGAAGQQLKLDPPKFTSPCSQGLRNDVDEITFRGTAGKDLNSLVAKGWKTSIEFQMAAAKSPGVYVKLCHIDFGPSGSNCGNTTTTFCFCERFDTPTGEAHFVVQFIVEQKHSEGMIRAQWMNTNDPALTINRFMALPQIYDANKATVTLKVNNVLAKQTSYPFGVDFLANGDNIIELCCIDSAMPCLPTLTIDGANFTSDTNCVNHTVVADDVSFKANITLAYSICNPSGNLTAGFGIIATVEAVPPDGGGSNHTTDGKGLDRTTIRSSGGEKASVEEDVCPLFFCGLSIVLSLLFLAILATVTCFVVWAKRHKSVNEVEAKPATETLDLDSFPRKSRSNNTAERDDMSNPDKAVAETDADAVSVNLEESPAVENVPSKDDFDAQTEN